MDPNPIESTSRLAAHLQVGDLVFIRIPLLPFRKVAEATCSWTNHVGIVLDVSGQEPVIGVNAALEHYRIQAEGDGVCHFHLLQV